VPKAERLLNELGPVFTLGDLAHAVRYHEHVERKEFLDSFILAIDELLLSR